MRPTQAAIHLNNLRNNVREVRNRIGAHRKVCAAVKGDGYGHGHGAVQISKTVIEEGVTHLGVATVSEGKELREAGIKAPILLYGLTIEEEMKELVHYNLSPFVTGADIIYLLNREATNQNKTIGVHMKVDTGLGRIGCRPDHAYELCCLINDKRALRLDGICTHFADAQNRQYTMNQLQLFKGIVNELRMQRVDPGIVHAANSSIILYGYEEAFLDMVRPGIMLYGYNPSPFSYWQTRLKPVMSLRTKVVFIKKVKALTPISYGLTYKTTAETQIATLPIGYVDGYNRLLSEKGKVLINNRNYQICGKICMDQCMVDIGLDSEVHISDDVVLFGFEQNAMTAADIAAMLGTISNEVLCSVNKRVPRVYLMQ